MSNFNMMLSNCPLISKEETTAIGGVFNLKP